MKNENKNKNMELKEKIEKANIKVSDIATALDIPQSTVYRCINNQGYISNYLLINKYVNERKMNMQREQIEAFKNILKKEFNIEIECYCGGFIFNTNFKYITLKHNSIINNIYVLFDYNLFDINDLEVFKLEIEKAQVIISVWNKLFKNIKQC